jgi:hypothetical protein
MPAYERLHPDFSGQANLTFSCQAPDGTVKTGQAKVNIREVYPGSLDF